jgi:amidohydrolase
MTGDPVTSPVQNILSGLSDIIQSLEDVYKDLHSHPELSMQEHRTANIAAEYLKKYGYQVTTGIGGTGLIGVLENGKGPSVMLRADMDGLPMKENTGLEYTSTATGDDKDSSPIAHACGHDMHVTWLMGVSQLFANNREAWSGTLVILFQPGEETAEGAKAMLDDGLYDKLPSGKPEVVLGQHVMVGPAGTVAGSSGPITFAADSLEIRLFGKGAHGSMPQSSIDPVVMAASIVLRLQTIVSRELSPSELAVVTVGSIQAGTKSNIIPNEAVIQMNIRTLDTGVRKRVLKSIERIVNAEAQASNAPKAPEIKTIDSYPLNVNDENASHRVKDAMLGYFGSERVKHTGPNPASEDFGCFGTELGIPSVYWFIGGTDPDTYDKAREEGTVHQLPVNHSPDFAPVLHPTLEMGVEAMTTAAMAWLRKSGDSA